MNLFRIVIPQSELRFASAERKPAKEVVWRPAPALGQGAYIELWLTPPTDVTLEQANFQNDFLGGFQLGNGQWVAATVRYLDIEPQDHQTLRNLRAAGERLRLVGDARNRGWALARSDQNVHALVEFAPCPD